MVWMMTDRNRMPPSRRLQTQTNRNAQVSLDPFQEIIGELEAIHRTDAITVVELSSGRLEFPAASVEAAICERKLTGREGERIAILRTASPEIPLRIRHSGSE